MRSEARRFVRVPDIMPGMTEMRLETLRLIALGMPRGRIASEIHGTKKSVKYLAWNSYNALEVNGELHAVLRLVSLGVFNLEELIAGFDLTRFNLLGQNHHKMLQRMVEDDGRDSGNKAIARDLGWTAKTVAQRMHEVHKTIDEFSRTRTAVLFVACQEKLR